MAMEAIAERVFRIDGQDAVCRFFQPEPDDGSYFCRYTINSPRMVKDRRIGGIDGLQSLLLAMQSAHVDLLIAREDDQAEVLWLGDKSLGLPVPLALRDLDAEQRL